MVISFTILTATSFILLYSTFGLLLFFRLFLPAAARVCTLFHLYIRSKKITNVRNRTIAPLWEPDYMTVKSHVTCCSNAESCGAFFNFTGYNLNSYFYMGWVTTWEQPSMLRDEDNEYRWNLFQACWILRDFWISFHTLYYCETHTYSSLYFNRCGCNVAVNTTEVSSYFVPRFSFQNG